MLSYISAAQLPAANPADNPGCLLVRAQQFGHLILLVMSLEIGLLTTSLLISKSNLGFLYLMVLKTRVKSLREEFFFCLSPQGTATKQGEQKAGRITPSRRFERHTKDNHDARGGGSCHIGPRSWFTGLYLSFRLMEKHLCNQLKHPV